jgi:hypothetical protein
MAAGEPALHRLGALTEPAQPHGNQPQGAPQDGRAQTAARHTASPPHG